MARFCLGLLASTGVAMADLDIRPAARMHVRYVDGTPMRHTSKLERVVELNFTFGSNHVNGKQAIDRMLSRISADYALGRDSAFALRKFVGSWGGAGTGLPDPIFTLDDLQAADVIVTNNIGNMNDLPVKSIGAASAFETAVRGGKSVLSFHGSAEAWGATDWKFYSEEFFPFPFEIHSHQIPVPVYRNDVEADHVVLEHILDSGTTPMQVLMGLDSAGAQILKPDVAARLVRNEMFQFTVNPLTDARYAPLSTCLLRYDPSSASTLVVAPQYRYLGGNAYSFILKTGAGKSAYITGGHDGGELTGTGESFDGGTGDFERYLAQMLFFLAGYRSEPCGGSVDCSGLQVVDARDHLTEETFGATSIRSTPPTTGFGVPRGMPYRAELLDVRGGLQAMRSGHGGDGQDFEAVSLRPGVYFLRIHSGKSGPRTIRYMVPPAP